MAFLLSDVHEGIAHLASEQASGECVQQRGVGGYRVREIMPVNRMRFA